MNIGITGTREGMTEYQAHKVYEFLESAKQLASDLEFHHGDCLGVDVEAAAIARALGYRIVCHPPLDNHLRGYADYDVIYNPQGYLARDRMIVNSVDLLLVVPLHTEWQSRGGTWYTHDYAVKVTCPLHIIWPKETP